MKHSLEGTMVICAAKGCNNAVRWGCKSWNKFWTSIWIETEEGCFSLDACSKNCSDRIKEGRYKYSHAYAKINKRGDK